MLGTLTRDDPAKEATERRKERARDLRDHVAELEAKKKALTKQLREHEQEVEAVKAEVREKGHHVQYATFPTVAAARERATKGQKLSADLRAVEQRLKVARRRAGEAEARATPLSDRARTRLEELVDAVQADRELAERGINIPQLLTTPAGRETLVERARNDYGIGADK